MGDGSGDEDGICETGEACGPAKGITPLVPYAYNMVSVPYHPNPNTPKDVFGDDVGAPLYAYWWKSSGIDWDNGCYEGVPAPYTDPQKNPANQCTTQTSAQFFKEIREGLGYFLWVPPGKIVLDVPSSSTAVPAENCVAEGYGQEAWCVNLGGSAFNYYVLPLQEGGNMIGTPFDKEIYLTSFDLNLNGVTERAEMGLYVRETDRQGRTKVVEFQNAVHSEHWIDKSVYTYNGVKRTEEVCSPKNQQDPVGTGCRIVIQPWKGYWIWLQRSAQTGQEYEILIPY